MQKVYGRDFAQQLRLIDPSLTMTSADNYVFHAIDAVLGARWGLDYLSAPGEMSNTSAQQGPDGFNGPSTKDWNHNMYVQVSRRQQRWTKLGNGKWKWGYQELF